LEDIFSMHWPREYIRSLPRQTVNSKGLDDGIQEALDAMKTGVSGVKLVAERRQFSQLFEGNSAEDIVQRMCCVGLGVYE
jgi:hypothetical protein